VNNGTKILKLCFGSDCSFLPGLDSSVYEEQYQTIYKPLISSLYAQPELFFTLYLSGTLIDWMEQHHEEFFMILEEMVSRKQIEVLGGGYYSPLFPLIPPADRVGQTELLTTVLRKYFGKRPRGAWLTASAW
jgi:alpha-amylase